MRLALLFFWPLVVVGQKQLVDARQRKRPQYRAARGGGGGEPGKNVGSPARTLGVASPERSPSPTPLVGRNLGRFCTGNRRSIDAIIYLGQKQHSSYDATHANTLNASMASLLANYAAVGQADVIVWHEGDLGPSDANALNAATNVRFCLLTEETGWAVPAAVNVDKLPEMAWSIGYRLMIRFYAVTVWPTLTRLGYEWVMRMDDDSFIHSPMRYNVFEKLRHNNQLYAYRMLSRECPKLFSDFIDQHSRRVSQTYKPGQTYCGALGQYGYYNNWFVTQIKWWRSNPQVAALIAAFDKSQLIFTRRANDLIFQTAAIKLFMAPEQRTRFVDFTYQHHTMRHGKVNYGGIESGTRDTDAPRRLAAYAKQFGGKIRTCDVVDNVHAKSQRILYVSPGPSSSAPACGKNGRLGLT